MRAPLIKFSKLLENGGKEENEKENVQCNDSVYESQRRSY